MDRVGAAIRRFVAAARRGLVAPGLAGFAIAASIGLLVILVLIIQNPPWQTPPPSDLTTRLDGLTGDQLSDAKTREETIQLALANRTAASAWGIVLAFVPLASATLGGIAIFATVWKTINDRQEGTRRDREEREAESQRRFRESFQTAVTNLSATADSLRGSAAVSLSTFLRPEYAAYHQDVLLVAIAKAKLGMEANENVRALVTRSVERGLRTRAPAMTEEDRRYELELAYCQLERIDLSGLDLHEADIAFASLRHANLRGANLFRARGIEVNLERATLSGAATNLGEARLRSAVAPNAKFHDAICISIRLEEAKLMAAEFQRARLQEAHFTGANLSGARFEGADLNNAYFAGATLDDVAIRSIAAGAKNWRKAHFDADQTARLNAAAAGIAGGGSEATVGAIRGEETPAGGATTEVDPPST